MEEPCERIPYSEMCISGEHFSYLPLLSPTEDQHLKHRLTDHY